MGSDRVLGTGYLLTLHVDLTRRSTNKIGLIILFAAKDVEAVYSQQKTRPGADCGSYHEHLIEKIILKLMKVDHSFKFLMIIQWK